MTTSSFSHHLMLERARLQVPRAKLADQCGVSPAVIKRWERGDSIPSVQQFKRLIGMLRRMHAHPPNWGTYSHAIVDGSLEQGRAELESELKDLERQLKARGYDDRPEAESFGEGLRRVREENEVTQEELGELLDLSGQAISAWENDNTTPVQVNLTKLYEVLPELRAGVDTGAIKRPTPQNIPVPVGSSGRPYPRMTTVDGEVAEAVRTDDHDHEWTDLDPPVPGRVTARGRICAICGMHEPKEESTKVIPQHGHVARCNECNHELKQDGEFWVCPGCRKIFKMMTPLSELAEAYARAKVAAVRAKQALAAAESAVVAAMMDLGAAEAAAKESLEILELAVHEEAAR